MKKILTIALAIAVVACSTPEQSASNKTLTNKQDSVAYAIGVDIASNLKQGDMGDLDPELIGAGMRDVMTGDSVKIDQRTAQMTIRQFMMEKQAQQNMPSAEDQARIESEKAFLADNATKEGVVVLPSGLQYQIMTEGTGPKPTATDRVKTHYHGTLINGTVFDSSVERGEPISFAVGGVIRGWTEALQLMPVGSKWKLFIPSDLAYGPRATGKIPANSALIFEVELLGIE